MIGQGWVLAALARMHRGPLGWSVAAGNASSDKALMPTSDSVFPICATSVYRNPLKLNSLQDGQITPDKIPHKNYRSLIHRGFRLV